MEFYIVVDKYGTSSEWMDKIQAEAIARLCGGVVFQVA